MRMNLAWQAPPPDRLLSRSCLIRRIQEPLKLQRPRIHRQATLRVHRPLLPRTIPVELDAVLIRIAQIERLAYSVIRRPIQPHLRVDQAIERITQRCTRRVYQRQVIEPGCSWSRMRSAQTFPGIQPNVMVVSARRDECGSIAKAKHQFEAKHTAVEVERAIQIGDLQVNMSHTDTGVDRIGTHTHTNLMYLHDTRRISSLFIPSARTDIKEMKGSANLIGVPDGIRTRVTAVKGRCPGPLDDGDAAGTGAPTPYPRLKAINFTLLCQRGWSAPESSPGR
jgi:hypothetical protein